MIVYFDVVPSAECAAFSQTTTNDRAMSVEDLIVMSVAMTNHTSTTLAHYADVEKKSGLDLT